MVTQDILRMKYIYVEDEFVMGGKKVWGGLVAREVPNRLFPRVAEFGVALIGTIAQRDDAYYVRCNVLGRLYYLQRLVWVYHFGEIEEGMEIDHRSKVTTDNRIGNLRKLTANDNRIFRRGHKSASSRFVGVRKARTKWYASAMLNGVEYSAGRFDNELDAAKARDRLALELFGELAYLNFPK